MRLGKARAQKSREDHHALVVRRARKPRLALDVDKARLAERDRGGDARGTTERVAADVEHGEPVDFADRAAVDANHQRAVRNKATNLLFNKVSTQNSFGQRALDVVRADPDRGFRAREKSAFAGE